MTRDEVKKALGYVRVSTTEERQGAGLEAQRQALRAEAERRGWNIEIVEDQASGGSRNGRPGLQRALTKLATHRADCLMVSKLDRLSRSAVDFLTLAQRAEREGWAIVILEPNIDLTTANGKLVLSVLAAVAEWERDMIRTRIREALQVKRAQGVRLGRRERLNGFYSALASKLRQDGLSLSQIRQELLAQGCPKPLHPSTIARTIQRHQLD